jgi:hypothetical protein
MTKRAHITLIHGTFAPNAEWTAETSAFCKAIIAGLDIDARFNRFQWSARNSAKERIAAADKLAASLRAERLNDPDCTQIVIGHSHGGSVLAYALLRYSELAKTVLGAFLSTPFIDARPRRNWFRTAMIVTLAFTSIPVALMGALETSCVDRYPQLLIKEPALSVFTTISLLLYLAPIYFSLFWAPRAIIKSNPKRMARDISTCRLPPGRYLFLRTTGDEVSGALSTAQFSSWLYSRLVNGATSIFPIRIRRRPFREPIPHWMQRFAALTRTRVPVLFLMLIPFIAGPYVLSIVVGTSFYLGLYRQRYPNIELLPSVWDALAYSVKVPDSLVATLVALLFALIFAVALGYFILIITFFLLSWFSHRAFGRASLGATMFLEMAVEPVPIGSHTVVHATWAARYGGLTHSLAYQNPETISAVREWIASIAQEQGVLNELSRSTQ